MRCYIKGFCILLCILLLLCAIIIFAGAFVIGGEWLLVKWNIQNPYVDCHYDAWKTVSVDDLYDFSIPINWTLEKTGDMYTIATDDGEVWAYGAVVGNKTGQFATLGDFYAVAFSEEPLAITFGSNTIESRIMNGSYLHEMVVTTTDTSQKVFFISMFIDTDKSLVWLINADLSSDSAQFDIAEAIAYSYAFQKP